MDQQCLFCLKRCPLPPRPPEAGILGAVNCKSLEIRLLQHFVVRRLLSIPRIWCEEAMQKYGGGETAENDSDSWLRICHNCSILVNRAWDISQQLISLESSFKEVQDQLKEKMGESIHKLRRKTVECWQNDIRYVLYPDHMPVHARRKPKIEITMLDDSLLNYVQPEQILELSLQQNDLTDDRDYCDGNENEEFITNFRDFLPSSDPLHINDVAASDEKTGTKRMDKSKKQKKKMAQIKASKRDGVFGTKLKSRKRNKHSVRKFRKCPICPATAKDPERLKDHINFHEECKEMGFICPECSFPTKTQEELEIHKYNEHDREVRKFTRSFACGKCEFTADIWKNLRDHATAEHPGVPDSELGPDIQLFCNFCDTYYDTANILIYHQKKMHPELFGANLETVKCPECPQIFPSLIHFHYHTKSTHMRDNSFVCEVCGKGFSQERRLARHKIMHEPPRQQFICHICGLNYNYKSALIQHYKRFHPDVGVVCNPKPDLITAKSEETFSCKYCEEKFSFKISMLRHLETHKQEIGIQCEICSKYYVNNQGLKQHMKLSHATSDQSTPCPYCFKLFSNPHAMHTHSKKYCKVKKMSAGEVQSTISSIEDRANPLAKTEVNVENPPTTAAAAVLSIDIDTINSISLPTLVAV